MNFIFLIHLTWIATIDFLQFAALFPSLQTLFLKNVENVIFEGLGNMRHSLQNFRVKSTDISTLESYFVSIAGIPSEDREQTLPPTKAISYTASWPKLVFLQIQGCQLRHVPPYLHIFVNLVHLDLSHNLLTAVHCLKSINWLKVLNLSHNQITEESIPEINTSVRILNLSHNYFESMEGMDRLQSLCRLDLSHNRLGDVDELRNLRRLPLLQALILQGNPFCDDPDYRLQAFHVFLEHALFGLRTSAASDSFPSEGEWRDNNKSNSTSTSRNATQIFLDGSAITNQEVHLIRYFIHSFASLTP